MQGVVGGFQRVDQLKFLRLLQLDSPRTIFTAFKKQGLTSVSPIACGFLFMQCTTQRVYSKRDLFKTIISINIARDHHNRIIHRFIEL